MKIKIVSDSSCDIHYLDHVDFTSVPLHIIVGDKEFADDENLDVVKMQKALDAYKDKTSTSCPSTAQWIDAFGDADVVFCLTITSQLSGSFNSAMVAKRIYEEEHPDRKIHVLDSLSTGPEVTLIVEKLQELILQGLSPDEILNRIVLYMVHTHLLYSLTTLNNLARNGRVNPILAKGIGLLDIRIIGVASEEGTIQAVDKARGDKRAIPAIVKQMKKLGYAGGRVIIAHHANPAAAEALSRKIAESFGGSFNGYIHACGGLDSYYAEPGAMLIGFET